jgi:hypothetical protein
MCLYACVSYNTSQLHDQGDFTLQPRVNSGAWSRQFTHTHTSLKQTQVHNQRNFTHQPKANTGAWSTQFHSHQPKANTGARSRQFHTHTSLKQAQVQGQGKYVGLTRAIYIWCIYGVSGREITKYSVIHGVCLRFRATLCMMRPDSNCSFIWLVAYQRTISSLAYIHIPQGYILVAFWLHMPHN